MKNKSTKHALLASVLSIVMCFAMLISSTFAWFTDEVKSGMNKIVAGNLDVELYHSNGNVTEEKVNETTNLFIGKDGNAILWEPGVMVYENFTVKNEGTLALKYRLTLNSNFNLVDGKSLKDVLKVAVIEGAFDGDRATAQALTFDKTLEEFEQTGVLAAGAADDTYAIVIYWEPSDRDNDYNIAGSELFVEIGASLVATQAASENDSFDNQYDKDAKYPDTVIYTLAEFNALTEIPVEIRTVYVDLSGNSIQDGLTIGNDAIADHYNYGNWNSDIVPDGYPHDTGKIDTRSSDGAVRHLYSTGKNGINLVLTGMVSGAEDTGTFNAGKITLKVPDASSVTFENVTFGAGQMCLSSWQESFQSTVRRHSVKSIEFNTCTFNGNWIQNGSVDADDMYFKGCTFSYYENTKSSNNSNPIWIQNMGQCNVVIEGCIFDACRPIKLWENSVSGTVTIKNNTFNMQKCSADDETTYKNDAILFSTIAGPLGDVLVSGNTVNGGTSFLTFFNPAQITMADGATFIVSDNNLNGTKNSVEWKTATDFIPDFVTVK